MMSEDIQKRKEVLRSMIPKTKKGLPKTDRLEHLDSLLYSRKFSMEDLDFVEVEIKNSIEFFETKRMAKEKSKESAKAAST